MLLQGAINGGRMEGQHPRIPVTPDRIVEDAVDVVEAGADELHIHVRNAKGVETLVPESVGELVTRLRAACPGTPFGFSTSADIEADPKRRRDLIAGWRDAPDYVSVNIHEEGALDLIELLIDKGIGVEAGVWTRASAERFCSSPVAARCHRVLVEVFAHSVEKARGYAEAIDTVLDCTGPPLPRLLHGMDVTAWPMVDRAIEHGYDTRVGFEDMLAMPVGDIAPNNAALVAEAIRRGTVTGDA